MSYGLTNINILNVGIGKLKHWILNIVGPIFHLGPLDVPYLFKQLLFKIKGFSHRILELKI